MGTETRPSGRTEPTANHTKRKGKNRIRAVRKNVVVGTVRSHTVSGEMDFALLRNSGDNDIKVNFKNDNMLNNYFTIKPGETVPAIGIFNGTVINYQSVRGSSVLECILWA